MTSEIAIAPFDAYRGARVFVTGHTGFVGGHLVNALEALGATVEGFSLPDDVRRYDHLHMRVAQFRPDFLFHLAAQAFVPVGFEMPRYTFEVNAGGTVNVLEALRKIDRPCAVVIVTTDKVYLPRRFTEPRLARQHLHPETDHLGGHAPYASSKAAAELAVEAYRSGFFAPEHRIAVATARAGNIIGPGDWGVGRLLPNAIRALRAGQPIQAWNPNAVRPWQHVDDVVDGYLRLGGALRGTGSGLHLGAFCEPWNFGPDEHHTVQEVIEEIIAEWGSGSWTHAHTTLRETFELRVDSSKARARLGWRPTWNFKDMIHSTVADYKDDADAGIPAPAPAT